MFFQSADQQTIVGPVNAYLNENAVSHAGGVEHRQIICGARFGRRIASTLDKGKHLRCHRLRERGCRPNSPVSYIALGRQPRMRSRADRSIRLRWKRFTHWRAGPCCALPEARTRQRRTKGRPRTASMQMALASIIVCGRCPTWHGKRPHAAAEVVAKALARPTQTGREELDRRRDGGSGEAVTRPVGVIRRTTRI